MNRDSIWKILTEDLDMRKVCTKMVPEGSRHAYQDIVKRLETEPDLLRRVVTSDVS